MIKVKLKKPSFGKMQDAIDLSTISHNVATEMHSHWQGMLATGRQPSGQSLPANAEGLPMGLGSGTFAKALKIPKKPPKNKGKGKVRTRITMKGLDKRHAIAWHWLNSRKARTGRRKKTGPRIDPGFRWKEWAYEGKAKDRFERAIQVEIARMVNKMNKG